MHHHVKLALFIGCYCICFIYNPCVETIQPLEDHFYWNSSDTRRYPWLKFCDEKGQYEIQPGFRCSKGVYFPGGYRPECVCPFGLWIVKTEICQTQTHFLLGDGRHDICFLVDFKIESLIFLGDPDNVFASKAYVAPVHLSVFYEIPLDGSFSPLLDLEKPFIIHMFPINNRSIETEDGNCFPMMQPNQVNVPVHIWSSALGPTRYRVVDKCSNTLNYGYDELISPNIVFVRSNLIDLNLNVPKPRQCSSDLITKCNQFTTTVRPPQFHTPRNHQTIYYDLAEVSPENVEQLKIAQSKTPFHSVEVMAPHEGNFSQLFSDPAEELELPVMVGIQTYMGLLNDSSHETEGVQGEPESDEDASVDRLDDEYKKDELVREIVTDVLKKDTFAKEKVLRNLKSKLEKPASQHFPESGQKDRSSEESVKSATVEEKNELRNAKSDSNMEAPNPTSALTNETSEDPFLSRKRSISDSELESLTEQQPYSWINIKDNKNSGEHQKTIMEPSDYYQDWVDSDEMYPSGVCIGQTIPPTYCETTLRFPFSGELNSNFGSSKVPIHQQRRSGSEGLLINTRTTNGTQFLTDLYQIFNVHVVVDDDLMHTAAFADKSAEYFHKFCRIPEIVIPPSSLKMAMRIMLARVPFKYLKSFSTRLLKSTKFSFDAAGRILENCINDTGKIEFLFEKNKCPLKVSCTKYSVSLGASVKIITRSEQTSIVKSSKTILSYTLDAIILSLKTLCDDTWQDGNEFYGIKNALSKLLRLILKYDRSTELRGAEETSNFTEKDVQTFLKITNLPAYLTLLDKCMSAVETISENRGTLSSALHYSSPTAKKLFLKRKRKIREKRSSRVGKKSSPARRIIPTVPNPAYHPERVFDGIGICLNSFWDGVNRSNKDHDCIPAPPTHQQ